MKKLGRICIQNLTPEVVKTWFALKLYIELSWEFLQVEEKCRGEPFQSEREGNQR